MEIWVIFSPIILKYSLMEDTLGTHNIFSSSPLYNFKPPSIYTLGDELSQILCTLIPRNGLGVIWSFPLLLSSNSSFSFLHSSNFFKPSLSFLIFNFPSLSILRWRIRTHQVIFVVSSVFSTVGERMLWFKTSYNQNYNFLLQSLLYLLLCMISYN